MIEMRLLFLISVVAWQATGSNADTPLDRVINSVNTFSNNVVKVIAEDVSGNLVCSAISADIVLSMVTFGARGHTEEVLRSALALTDDDSLTLQGYQSLHDTLATATDFELRMANKIYLAKGFEPKADFRGAVETGFRSLPENIDFGDPSEAAKIVNHWTKVQTNNHIKDLVKPDDFKSTTQLVLVNAIYFKANWESQFTETDTKPRPFHVNGEILKDVSTMYKLGMLYRFGELPEVKAKFLELPYEWSDESIDEVSMFIILPDEINGIGELVKNIGKVPVKRLIRGARRPIRVYLPKFKIESTIDLEVPLTKLGLGEIFNNSANFTGIVASPPLRVSKILQKAFIEVNEKGTEATGATTLEFADRLSNDDKPIDFVVDHPFVAVIATRSGLILFSSVVMEPIY